MAAEDRASTSSALGSDFIAQGRRVGEWLAQRPTARRPSWNSPERQARRSQSIGLGFRDAIGSYPHMKIVATQTADFRGRGSARNGKHHPGQGSRHHRGVCSQRQWHGRHPGSQVSRHEARFGCDGRFNRRRKAALEAIIRGELGVKCQTRVLAHLFSPRWRSILPAEDSSRIILDRLFDVTNAKDFVHEAY